jgi:hypothetical protein
MEDFRRRLRRRLAPLLEFFSSLRASHTPLSAEYQTQRVCPFCGLITPRRKSCCLECGKSFKPA